MKPMIDPRERGETADSIPPSDPGQTRARALGLLNVDLGLKAYIWMLMCGLVGLGCFLYGIYGSSDVIFYTAFGVWGASLIPMISMVLTKAVEVMLGSPVVVGIVFFGLLLAALFFLLRQSPAELLENLLTNPEFVRFLIVGVVSLCILSVLAILGFVARTHTGHYFSYQEKRLEASQGLDQTEQENEVRLEESRLRQQLELKKLELEHEQIKIEQKKLEIAEAKQRLLLESDRQAEDGPRPG